MTNFERRNLEATVDYLITIINHHLSPEVVESVLQRYNAHSVWRLSDHDLAAVFEELDIIAADVC